MGKGDGMKAPERIPPEEWKIIAKYLDDCLRDADYVVIRREWWDDIQDYAYTAHRVYETEEV